MYREDTCPIYFLHIFIFKEYTNIKTLAVLSQEYQIDWLSNQIENYLSQVKITDNDLILEYIELSKRMDFEEEVVTNLINQISDYFPTIQSNASFYCIGCEIQMRIARKRLNDLMVARVSIPQQVRNCLLFDKDNGLGYFFRDIFFTKKMR